MGFQRFWKMGRRRVKRGVSLPSEPIIVPNTGEYNGNDGPWSTFSVRVGNPPQVLKVLAATSSPEMWVVGPGGCGPQDPVDCPIDRGQTFNTLTSSSWQHWQNESLHNLDDDRGLPLAGVGDYGSDMMTLMYNEHESTVLPNQTVAQITSKDYFLGMIGLSPRDPSPDKRKHNHGSNLVELKNRGIIPSVSYGYTAGARYRRQGTQARQAHANLILGGYNGALAKHNDIDFQMGPEQGGKDLTVSVRRIKFDSKTTGSMPLLEKGFSAVIDSAVSHYWLPLDACKAFEKAFDLVYNATTGIYLLNETQHTQLSIDNPTVSFTLGQELADGPEVTFVIPYGSFELRINGEFPLIPKWSRYFPLRRATEPSQYTLGRAFLQETYLTANYERRNFSVSARNFDSDNLKSNIVAIRDPKGKTAPDDVSSAATYGLIAGGCALAGILILFLIWRCNSRREKKQAQLESATDKAELDSTTRTIFELDKSNEIFELNGKPSRVEAINPELKCEYDVEEQDVADNGPFELPASEPSSHSITHRTSDELISPIEGTVSSGTYTVSTYHPTISPITPIERTYTREKT